MAFEPLRRLFCIFSLRIVTTSTEEKTSLFKWHNQKMVKISIIYIALDVKITLIRGVFFCAETQPCFKISIAKVQPFPPV